ncbi:MAG: hypothetical protein FWD69_14460 [Polyangiaceae bacterium]|nr:hypothetical protein [Polyangiaceae bacterium]
MSTARDRRGAGLLVAWAFAAICALCIALVQPGLASIAHKVRQRDDVFLLPPPTELRAMTLGYHAAATDLLWANLILEYGLHAQEKRAFPDITRYIDGILAMEPDFLTLYKYVDTLLVFNAMGGTEEDARRARAYLERGTRERPYDAAVWLQYGQFTAFLAPSFLKDEEEIQRWRVEGASAIAHAVELGADAQRSLAASSILSKAGETKATIAFLQRAYAMTDDPDTRQQIMFKLQSLHASSESADAAAIVDADRRRHFPFLSRSAALLVGPYRPAAKCAGPWSYEKQECPRDWPSAIAETR